MRWRYVITDLITSSLAFLAFNQVRYVLMNIENRGLSFSEFLCEPKMVVEQIVIPLFMLCIYWLSGYYNHPFGKSRLQEFSQTAFSAVTNAFFIYMVLLINDQVSSRYINYEILLLLLASLFSFTYIGRFIITQSAINNLQKRKWGFRTVIVGESEEAINVALRLKRSQAKLGFNIIGHLPVPGETPSTRTYAKISYEDFEHMCAQKEVDQLILVPEESASEKTTLSLLYEYFPSGISIKIRPSSLSFLTSGIRIRDIYAEPFIDIASPSMSDAQLNLKRVFDITASTIALVVLSPLMLAIAIAVKCSSKGPVFYKQERIGYRHRPFMIWKFRSMRKDAENDVPRLSLEDDPRITPIGRILRKYRLDELPQFWNVIKGEMSLVGPRPEREFFIQQIVKKAPHYTLVHQVKPGITSWGMVKYGYASNVDEMVERSNYELIYLANMSIAVDFKIMLHTISTVLLGKGK